MFLRAWSRCGYDASRGSLQGWLQMMTKHTAIDWVRRETAHKRRSEHVGATQAVADPPIEDEIDAVSTAARVRAAVAVLPQAERVAITLAFFGGLSYRQVAERLGVPEGTIKSQIRRGLLRLGSTLRPVS